MIFRLDTDRMRVVFSLDARDLALALVEVEGFEVVGEDRRVPKGVGPARFALSLGRSGVEPSQDAPGLWTYRIARRRAALLRRMG